MAALPLSGLVVAIIYRFIAAVGELRRTREELARSAVDAERLRFARDMHDLLGHTLSVMVVNQDHYVNKIFHDPGEHDLTVEELGTPYVITAARGTTSPPPTPTTARSWIGDAGEFSRWRHGRGAPAISADFGTPRLQAWTPKATLTTSHDLILLVSQTT